MTESASPQAKTGLAMPKWLLYGLIAKGLLILAGVVGLLIYVNR